MRRASSTLGSVLAALTLLAAPLAAQPPGSEPQQASSDADVDAEPAGEGGDAIDDEPSGDDGGQDDDAEGEAERERPPLVIVIDALPIGIDPVVGRHVSRRMRITAQQLGYRVLSGPESVAAAQRLRMPYPPTPADLWRVTYVAEARRGLFARVWAHHGRYHIELSAASLDGGEPAFARVSATAEELHEVVAAATREVLPGPDVWDDEGYERYVLGGGQQQATDSREPRFEPYAPRPMRMLPRRRRDSRPSRRIDLGIDLLLAIGAGQRFQNVLGGARLGVRLTDRSSLGLQLRYVNLRAREGRGANVLMSAMFEHRVRPSLRNAITIPLRVSLGYLPFNGPVIGGSAGVNIPFSSRVELHLDLVAPTVWTILGISETVVSMNVGAELIFRLGGPTGAPDERTRGE